MYPNASSLHPYMSSIERCFTNRRTCYNTNVQRRGYHRLLSTSSNARNSCVRLNQSVPIVEIDNNHYFGVSFNRVLIFSMPIVGNVFLFSFFCKQLRVH